MNKEDIKEYIENDPYNKGEVEKPSYLLKTSVFVIPFANESNAIVCKNLLQDEYKNVGILEFDNAEYGLDYTTNNPIKKIIFKMLTNRMMDIEVSFLFEGIKNTFTKHGNPSMTIEKKDLDNICKWRDRLSSIYDTKRELYKDINKSVLIPVSTYDEDLFNIKRMLNVSNQIIGFIKNAYPF